VAFNEALDFVGSECEMPPLSAAAGADCKKVRRAGPSWIDETETASRSATSQQATHGLLFHAAHKGKVNVFTPPSEVMIKRLGEAGVIASGNLDVGFDHAYLPC
jgi:hypothetical protein